jgi:hypothetical protein
VPAVAAISEPVALVFIIFERIEVMAKLVVVACWRVVEPNERKLVV